MLLVVVVGGGVVVAYATVVNGYGRCAFFAAAYKVSLLLFFSVLLQTT